MKKQLIACAAFALLTACSGSKTTTAEADKFDYTVEQFADLQILRYRVPGFENLSLQQKELVYYLTEAALQGRDILFDQNGKYNLRIRRTLEAVYTGYKGDKNTPDFKAMEVYLKRVWFSNGIHHHYGSEKFVPGFAPEFFKEAVLSVDTSTLPLAEGQTAEQLCDELFPVIFDPAVMPKRVNQAAREDLVEFALQFIGCKYKDAGSDPHTGVDCSGFTRYVMKYGAGVNIARSSVAQSGEGKEVNEDQMRPGDLVFYSKNGKNINHVAMYIGDGMVVHASTYKTGVKTSPWNYRTPVKIVNVLGD